MRRIGVVLRIRTCLLERALRPIPMGCKNGLFCWTEVGARHAGIVQRLLATCRLHGIDATTCRIDVLQRVGQHPASRVAELSPWLWKQHFAEHPLRSDMHSAVTQARTPWGYRLPPADRRKSTASAGMNGDSTWPAPHGARWPLPTRSSGAACPRWSGASQTRA
jgi:hypothetical protein